VRFEQIEATNGKPNIVADRFQSPPIDVSALAVVARRRRRRYAQNPAPNVTLIRGRRSSPTAGSRAVFWVVGPRLLSLDTHPGPTWPG
jgi:hypothetical protein